MVPKLIGLYSSVPQSGKSTVAESLWINHGFWINRFAEPLKGMVDGLLTDIGLSVDAVANYRTFLKEETIPQVGKSYRELCQTLGTDWGRELVHPDIWVRAAMRRVTHAPVVFDDVRFPNEAAAIVARGGAMWKIHNPNVTASNGHVSDGGLEEWNFHRIIVNDGTKDDLDRKVAEVLNGAA